MEHRWGRGDDLAEGSRLCPAGGGQDAASHQESTAPGRGDTQASLPGLALPSWNLSEPTYLLCEGMLRAALLRLQGKGWKCICKMSCLTRR